MTVFVSEKPAPVMTDNIYGAKAYLKIRREAKMMDGALGRVCSRKRVMR